MFNKKQNKIRLILISGTIFIGSFLILAIRVEASHPPTCAAGVAVCIINAQVTKTHNSARVTWTTNIPTATRVQYWINPRGVSDSPSNSTSQTTSHTAEIPNLNPETFYNFIIYSTASDSGSPNHIDSFTTNRTPTSDPVTISGETVTNKTTTGVTITWTTNIPATSQVEYWLVATNRIKVPATAGSNLTTSHSIALSGLSPGVTYNYRVNSTAGGFPAQGTPRQFTTQNVACADPVCISGVQATNLTTNSVTITWTTSVPADSQVKYGPTSRLGLSTSLDTARVTSHSVNITGLNPGYPYYFEANSVSTTLNNFRARSGVQVTMGGTIGGETCGGADQPACPPGSGCGTPGQPACPPGRTQTYPFEITNPLKGGANDFAGLVKILAQWIFNLAIPIAVAMIVYSGILFLTAAGEPAKVTKARDVLKYAVIGLAIILIGSGFVTLIQSILKLGAPSAETSSGGTLPGDTGGIPIEGDGFPGGVGRKCSGDRDCFTGLICKDKTICQRPTGNWVGEPCVGGTSCDVGLACDKSGDAIQPIDGQTLGSCYNSGNTIGLPVGYVCTKDSECISGLKCNQICQRKDGNLNGEACLKTSSTSNCESRACHTTGAEVRGDCVPYSGT